MLGPLAKKKRKAERERKEVAILAVRKQYYNKRE